MVAVVVRLRAVGLAELEVLVLAHPGARHGAVAVFQLGGYCHDLRIEIGNALRRPEGDIEFDIGDAERDAPEPRGVRLVAAHAIAPGTYRLDMVVVLAEGEGGAGELCGDGGEPVEQGLAAGDDDAGMTAQHLRRTARQMKLAAADIDPHVAVGHHQIGIAGQPEAGDIEQGRQPLVGHLDVDVFEMDRVAEIFGGAVEWLLHGRGP